MSILYSVWLLPFTIVLHTYFPIQHRYYTYTYIYMYIYIFKFILVFTIPVPYTGLSTEYTYLGLLDMYYKLPPITSNYPLIITIPQFNPNLNIKISRLPWKIGAAVIFNYSIYPIYSITFVHSEILPTCVAHCNKPIPSASRFLSSNRFIPTSSSSC